MKFQTKILFIGKTYVVGAAKLVVGRVAKVARVAAHYCFIWGGVESVCFTYANVGMTPPLFVVAVLEKMRR